MMECLTKWSQPIKLEIGLCSVQYYISISLIHHMNLSVASCLTSFHINTYLCMYWLKVFTFCCRRSWRLLSIINWAVSWSSSRSQQRTPAVMTLKSEQIIVPLPSRSTRHRYRCHHQRLLFFSFIFYLKIFLTLTLSYVLTLVEPSEEYDGWRGGWMQQTY